MSCESRKQHEKILLIVFLGGIIGYTFGCWDAQALNKDKH